MKYYSLILALVIGLSGCPVNQVKRIPASSPLAHPTAIAAVGDFKHDPSGYLFPVRVGEFQRVGLLQYDAGELDVSAGYNDVLPGCLVALTIYIYPTPRMTFVGADPAVVRSIEDSWLGGGYSHAKEEIIGAHPEAVLEIEDAATRDGLSGKKAVYSIGGAESELDLFVVQHSWFLKFRATYPIECSMRAREAVRSFHAAWGGRGG